MQRDARRPGIKLLFHSTRYEMYMTGFFSGPKRQCLNSIISEFENGYYATNTLDFLFCLYSIRAYDFFAHENMKKPPSKVAKGQIKQKQDWRILDSPKKPTKRLNLFSVKSKKANKTNLFVRSFLWRIYSAQICFRF